jgi:hypothetical protein
MQYNFRDVSVTFNGGGGSINNRIHKLEIEAIIENGDYARLEQEAFDYANATLRQRFVEKLSKLPEFVSLKKAEAAVAAKHAERSALLAEKSKLAADWSVAVLDGNGSTVAIEKQLATVTNKLGVLDEQNGRLDDAVSMARHNAERESRRAFGEIRVAIETELELAQLAAGEAIKQKAELLDNFLINRARLAELRLAAQRAFENPLDAFAS